MSEEKALQIPAEHASEEPNAFLDLAPNHRRFVNLYMSGQYSMNKIAELMNVSRMTINRWMKREDVTQFLTEMTQANQKIVSMQLNAMTEKAAAKLNKLIDSNIDGVALQAVKDVLDRGGHKAKQEIKKEVVHSFEQQLQDVISSSMGDIIDVDITEEE